MRTWPQVAPHPVILGESLRRVRHLLGGLARATVRQLRGGIEVNLIPSRPCARHLPFFETAIEGAAGAPAPATRLYRGAANSGRDRIVPGTVAAFGPDACLAEQNCQQARAQEHEAGRRQNKKSVGDYVVVAHDTPTTSNSRPNLLKLSESPMGTTKPFLCPKAARVTRPPAVQNSSSGTIAFKCMG